MSNELILLLKLLLAHFVADFLLQSKTMVEKKSFSSIYLYYHGVIVFLVSWLFSFALLTSLVIAAIHIVIDGIKSRFDYQSNLSKYYLFIGDQLAHIFMILFVWIIGCSSFVRVDLALSFNEFLNTQNTLELLVGYLVVTFPAGYFIELFIKAKGYAADDKTEKSKGGFAIGILERLIVMTFVLLGQYEAIGFLITAKSLLRFADKNPEVKSELVLIGTLLSFAIAILIGLVIKGDAVLVGQ